MGGEGGSGGRGPDTRPGGGGALGEPISRQGGSASPAGAQGEGGDLASPAGAHICSHVFALMHPAGSLVTWRGASAVSKCEEQHE